MSDNLFWLRLPIDDLDRVFNAVGPRWERLRGQRLLLTGGTGFIGKWLLATFLHANQKLALSAHIVVLSRRPKAFLEEFPELHDSNDVTWLSGDVRDLAPDAPGDCNFAIHAATDVATTCTPTDILDSCIAGTRRVLDSMVRGATARRLLLLSSGAIYGRTPPELSVIPEEWAGAPDPLTPASAYGEGKRISEMLCAMAASEIPNLEVSIARCFAFVGPYLPLDKHFAIGNFISAALRGEDIRIQGDGTPLRTYLYASDLAHWLWVMLFDAPSGRAFNVGGVERLSIGALAHRVNRTLGSNVEVRITQTPCPSIAPQAYVPSVDRIAVELGLVPSVGLDDAILRTARWVGQTSRD
ncbi:NAD-dependent epimerase/dehydratase family protein [Zwartia panacis]|uniref:NAD-dependent epimerase/dehydratase family protein n=1 Tax=Zwartia panacis TaxID=2683345 RepID=UPI0025B33544|nr:NAD-dependent epimerase/dehydratase family protein [Zwartia panacis]MDN4018017.1 NAD-dependent epimerase/dehydratase family protein [Zwartia panacis]